MTGTAVHLPPLPDPTDRAAMAEYLTAHRQFVAGEAFRSIRALAAEARNGQWVHKDTATALDKILEFAAVGVGVTTDEDEGEEWSPDFPP